MVKILSVGENCSNKSEHFEIRSAIAEFIQCHLSYSAAKMRSNIDGQDQLFAAWISVVEHWKREI